MDWYLRDIIIYGRNNQIRSLPFHRGVNIITGENGTGKTALLGIVDYCLGSSKCRIPVETIRDFALWYAIRLQTNAEQLFLARKNPEGKHKVTDAMYIRVGMEIPIPEKMEHLRENTDRDAVVRALSQKLGLMDQSLAESSYDGAYTEAPTIRNVAPFLFQSEDIIANKTLLFEKISQPEYQKRLRRIFPYILGIIDGPYLQLKNDLEGEKRVMRRLERLKEEQDALLSGDGKAYALWNYAVTLNLAQSLPLEEMRELPLRKRLARILEKFSHEPMPDPVVDDVQLIASLKANIRDLYAAIATIRRQLVGAEELAKRATEFTGALQVQSGRLHALDLLPQKTDQATTCPLCSQELPHVDANIMHLLHVRDDLQKQISEMNTVANPQLNTRIREFYEKLAEYRAKLNAAQSKLSDLYRVQENANSANEVWAEQQRHLGAIRFYLEQVPERPWDFSELSQRMQKSNERLQKIEDELARLNPDEQHYLVMDELSKTMTKLSQHLNLEKPDEILRLDIQRFTLIRTSSFGREARLDEIGSGENAIGYHLCVLFALHIYFLEHNSPVPSFLFLDQPSQVYYGGTKKKSNVRKKEQQIDLDAVHMLYDMIIAITASLQDRLQVIVVDHVRLPEKYRQFTNEEWWDGKKLI